MKQLTIWLGSIAVCAVVACSPQQANKPATAKTHAVTITGMLFVPPQLDAHAGDTIIWTNNDLVPHSATADNASFDSGAIAPRGSWQLTLKPTAATDYHCTFHPSMKGSLQGH